MPYCVILVLNCNSVAPVESCFLYLQILYILLEDLYDVHLYKHYTEIYKIYMHIYFSQHKLRFCLVWSRLITQTNSKMLLF